MPPVERSAGKPPPSVPVVRFSARPSVVIPTSETVSVPKLVPASAVPAAPTLPRLKPRSVLFAVVALPTSASVSAVAPEAVMVGAVPLMAGSGPASAGQVTPATELSEPSPPAR